MNNVFCVDPDLFSLSIVRGIRPESFWNDYNSHATYTLNLFLLFTPTELISCCGSLNRLDPTQRWLDHFLNATRNFYSHLVLRKEKYSTENPYLKILSIQKVSEILYSSRFKKKIFLKHLFSVHDIFPFS